GAEPERPTPARAEHDGRYQWRCDSRPKAHAGKNNAVGNPSLSCRDPSRHKLVGGRINDGFTDAQQKANGHEQGQRPPETNGNNGGQSRKYAPPYNRCRQHAARSEPISDEAAGRLEYGVSNEKGARERAQLGVAEMIFFEDCDARDSDIGAVDKGHSAQHEYPEDQEPAHSA